MASSSVLECLVEIRVGTIYNEEHLWVLLGSLTVQDRHGINQEAPPPRG